MRYKIEKDYDSSLCLDVWFAYDENGKLVTASTKGAEDCEDKLRMALNKPPRELVKEVEL